MILASGARGPGFNSQNSPYLQHFKKSLLALTLCVRQLLPQLLLSSKCGFCTFEAACWKHTVRRELPPMHLCATSNPARIYRSLRVHGLTVNDFILVILCYVNIFMAQARNAHNCKAMRLPEPIHLSVLATNHDAVGEEEST